MSTSRSSGAQAVAWTDGLPDGPPGDWLALPPGRPPRVLIERSHLVRDPQALRDVIGHTGGVRRATTGLAASALAAGGHRLLAERSTWTTVARRLLGLARRASGHHDARGIIRVSPSRPNSKPVVQLVGPDLSSTVAWVKIGWDELTRPLVMHEASVLRSLDPPPGLRVPPVLGVDDGPVAALALGPLVPDPATRRAGTPERLADAALRTFGPDGFGTDGETVMGDVATLSIETDHLAELPTTPLVTELRGRVTEFRDRHGDLEVRTGRWHGDWNRANAALAADHVAAWDWERSSLGAPLALDAAFALMFVLPPPEAARALAARLPGTSAHHRRALLSLAALSAVARHADLESLGVPTRSQSALARLDAHLRG